MEAGHAPAQAAYGYVLERGEGVTADPAGGCAWARRSAGQGNSGGLLNHGSCLLRGVGGARDVAGGVAQLEKSFALENPEAAFALGQFYRDGQYLPRDLALARQWFVRARDAGHTEADKALSALR